MTSPTGQQYEIRSGEQRAVVTEVGATLRHYSVAGRDVVAGFAADALPVGGQGQQLLPWPNRIRDGRYTFAGAPQQLSLSEPKRHNAIHGLVRHVPWTVLEHTDTAVTQRVVVYPRAGWPGVLEAVVTHRLTADGVEVEVGATNLGDADVPFGYAAHPYLTVGQSAVDEMEVRLPAARYLEVDERLLPVALAPVDGTPADRRSGGPLGETVLDTAFTDLAVEADGRWRVRVALGERRAELWAEPAFGWLQVFTGDHRRDVSLAVEPMTCGPDAFNPGITHDGMLVLAPGASFRGTWGISGR